MNPEIHINYMAIAGAVAASFVFGFLWYGPIFGKIWMAAMGKTQEELGSPTQGIIISGVSALIMAIALALLLTLPASTLSSLARRRLKS